MSFKEVKELRTSGKLEEALTLANTDLAADPLNVWNIRSISWVYYDYLKANAQINNFQTFIDYASKIIDLNLTPEDAQMLHDNTAMQFGKVIFALQGEESVNYSKIDSLFYLVKKLSISKASIANSYLIKSFLKGNVGWSRLIEFIDHFGFDGFQESDFLSEEYNGKAMSSLVEKYYNAYCKKLIATANNPETVRTDFTARVNNFFPILDAITLKHGEFQFLPYFKAKLLILIGENDKVLDAFLPFAKRKKNDFWVWEVIADIFPKGDERKFACYCKALSLKTPEEYLVGLRIDFAEILIEKGKFPEAKFEINKSIEVRHKKGWKIPSSLTSVTLQPWYSSTQESKSNTNFYKDFTPIAEELLFQNIEEEIVAVEFVNSDKKVLNFVKNELKHGFFSYKGLLTKPEIGDVLKIRFAGLGQEGRFQTLSIIKDNSLISEAVKDFNGKVKKTDDKEFAFVDNYFIEPRLVDKHKLEKNQEVSGKVILSFNKKKEQWGWKVFSITTL
jgi:tetratricopeptide (TPR) repeat protein